MVKSALKKKIKKSQSVYRYHANTGSPTLRSQSGEHIIIIIIITIIIIIIINIIIVIIIKTFVAKERCNRKASEEVKRTVCCGSENGRQNMTDLKQIEHYWFKTDWTWLISDWTWLISNRLNMTDFKQTEHDWFQTDWTWLISNRLNMTDFKQMQTAFLLQWVGSLFQTQVLDRWSHIPKKYFWILVFLFKSEKVFF